MAELDNPSLNIIDNERPEVMCRKRRGSTELISPSRPNAQVGGSRSHVISTPPTTPKRVKKRVEFSNPEPTSKSDSASSGLTPFVCRTTLSTPTSKRRRSTPVKLWNLDGAISGTLQFKPLRQVLDGRVKRRLRRNRLSEEVNNIEADKRRDAKLRKSEIAMLRELAAKDLEVQSMRDEQVITSQKEGSSGTSLNTNGTQSARVQELEQQIVELKAKLKRKVVDAGDSNWTMAAKDPYHFGDDDGNDNMMITNYDEDFTNGMNDELMTTPTRLNTSFPSPPSTMPNTPCKSVSLANAGIQASLPVQDPEADILRSRLESLQMEIAQLNSMIALNNDNNSRLSGKLSEFLPQDELHDHSALDSALDSVLTQLALSQSHALEKENAFSALSAEVTNLGFSTSRPEETLKVIAQKFRQARLDLEYATPGEAIEGFENDKLLEMLVSRVRILVQKVKEADDNIDQYHEQELLLRQQLNTRVDAQHNVPRELFLANSVVQDLRTEIDEKDVSIERLQRALDGYRAEVKGLEVLIEKLEEEGKQNEEVLKGQLKEVEERMQDEILKHDTTRAGEEGKEMIIVQLEQRLNAALAAAAEVREQIRSSSSSHGAALALRDARVSELRGEIERVNKALETAQYTIHSLRIKNKDIEGRIKVEKDRVAQDIREQVHHFLETNLVYTNEDVSVKRLRRESSAPPAMGDSSPQAVVRRGRFFNGSLARRSSGKRRRRYDSGVGFLEEVDEATDAAGIEI